MASEIDFLRELITPPLSDLLNRHASDAEIAQLEEGTLEEDICERLISHIIHCQNCCARIDTLMQASDAWDAPVDPALLTNIRSQFRAQMSMLSQVEPVRERAEDTLRFIPSSKDVHLSIGLLKKHVDTLLSSGKAHKALDRLRGDFVDIAAFLAEFRLPARLASGSVQGGHTSDTDDANELPTLLPGDIENPLLTVSETIWHPVSGTEWQLIEMHDGHPTIVTDESRKSQFILAWKYSLEWLINHSDD